MSNFLLQVYLLITVISIFLPNIVIAEINLGYTTRINSSTTFIASLGGILLEDSRVHDVNNPPCHKIILEPKSSDVKMLDLSYETYAPKSSDTTVATAIASPPLTPGNPYEQKISQEWDASLFVNLRSIKIVTMYGFLMAVKDFVMEPISPSEPVQSSGSSSAKKAPQNAPRKILLKFYLFFFFFFNLLNQYFRYHATA